MRKKIIPISKAAALGRKLKKQKKKIVFTNGTFDILHLGHVTYLEKAKTSGDILIIGLNTDRSVKSYKNPSRPVNPQNDRAHLLAALECVDYVILFDDPTPLSLILQVKPDVLVKGADWKKSEIAGGKEVESWGGKVKRVTLVDGRSTTQLIEKIKKL